MRFLILSLLALGYQTASAQLVTESFGSGDNAFTMDFVTIGNPNNAADTTGAPNPVGSVAYTYNLGKYEVSREQIDKANTAGSLGITMYDMTSYGGNGANRPATGINWFEAAGYTNWLNESKGYQAAYKFVGGTFQLWAAGDVGYNASNMFRNSLAKYVIASSDEWYKGAYGNLNGTWNNYATGSNSAPTVVGSGTAANTAVYGPVSFPADITSAGGLSPWGTMGQDGNAAEWNETAYDGINNTAEERRELRGGSWNFDSLALGASSRSGSSPTSEGHFIGFRVVSVSVPEPSTGLLVALGISGLLLKRRKTGTF
jgi:formylglycine-generating enzyme